MIHCENCQLYRTLCSIIIFLEVIGMENEKKKIIEIINNIENPEVLKKVAEYVETYVIIYDSPRISS